MGRQPPVLLVSDDRLAEVTTTHSLIGYGYDVFLTRALEEVGHLLRTNRRISVLVIDRPDYSPTQFFGSQGQTAHYVRLACGLKRQRA
jgi:hypothetical protein